MASIHLENASVAIPIYDASSRSLKKRLFSNATGGRIHPDPDSAKLSVVQALDGVTLSFRHGDRVGLIGHNGAGKTTLLRLLAGIYEPTGGTVRVVSPLDGGRGAMFQVTFQPARRAEAAS